MRQFAQKGFRIEQLSLEAKVLYSAFLCFSLAALVVSILYYSALVDDRPFEGAREYYAGEVTGPGSGPGAGQEADEAPPSTGLQSVDEDEGPTFDLPDDIVEEQEAPMLSSMTRRKLLEVTHFHLFTLPVFLLIIAHLFMLCRMRPVLKLASIFSAVLSSALHLLAPWLIFWAGGSWAWLMPVTGTWMTLSMLILMLWPMWAMWRPLPNRGAES